MTSSRVAEESVPDGAPSGPEFSGKGLRARSIGLASSVTLGLSSVAPAYSIAVTLGFVVIVVGDLAPAALVLGFVPMLLTAFAFRELNRDMPDCGTTFVWNTRAFGPQIGWLTGGWVPLIGTLIAMTTLAQVGAIYLLSSLGLDSLAASTLAIVATGIVLVAAVTLIAYRGLQLAASLQYVLLALQMLSLLAFALSALAHDGVSRPSIAWLNPVGFDGFGPFSEAVLLCLFIYWGWDTLITVNEETRDGDRIPGTAALISTVVLLFTYLVTAFAAISFAGTGTDGTGLGNPDTAADVLASLAPAVVGTGFARVFELAISVSAISALLNCVVGTPRSTLSMASHGALPTAFARIHPRYRTPMVGTVAIGAGAAVLLAGLTALSADFLGDAILSIGLLIAWYYGITALACVWIYRGSLLTSSRDLVLRGVLPLTGALIMFAAFARGVYDMIDPAYGYTSFHGVGGVFLLGVGSIALGVPVMLAVRARHRQFFRDGRTAVTALTVGD
jgi:amino acid transporter